MLAERQCSAICPGSGHNCLSDVTLWCIFYLQPTTTLPWVPCCTCRRRWLLSAVSAVMAVAGWTQSHCYSRVPWTRLQAVEYRSMYRTCHSFHSFLAKWGTLHSYLCGFLIVWSVSFLFLTLVLFLCSIAVKEVLVIMAALRSRFVHYIFSLWFLLSSSSFFPHLISAVGDWMSTMLPYLVWP